MALFYSLALLLVFSVTSIDGINKYSREANEGLSKNDKPFRIQKLNLLFEKAAKKLDNKSIQNLLNDLKHQDKNELLLKKLKAENQDKDGQKEAEIRRQMKMIVRKYGLDSNDLNLNSDLDQNSAAVKFVFKDKKLEKLWDKAQKGDFSEQQLKILKEEFRDYEKKMEQYHQLADELDHKHAKQQSRNEANLNHIDAFLESENNNNSTLEEVHERIKEKHFELKEEYNRLSDMVFNTLSGEGLKGEFDEENALKLWNIALKSDFNAQELESLKDELLHFQSRIKKLKYFEGQLELDRNSGKAINEFSNEPTDHQKHIVGRVNDLSRKLDKLHSEIEDRVLRRHSEL